MILTESVKSVCAQQRCSQSATELDRDERQMYVAHVYVCMLSMPNGTTELDENSIGMRQYISTKIRMLSNGYG